MLVKIGTPSLGPFLLLLLRSMDPGLQVSLKRPGADRSLHRGPQRHMNIRILHTGSKAQDKRDSRNSDLWNPDVHVTYSP